MVSRKTAWALLVSTCVAACGGGGVATGALTGSNNNDHSSANTATGSTTSPAISVSAAKLELVDSQGKGLLNPTLSQTEALYLKITAKNLQAFKRVEVSLENGLAVITPASGSLLTNESGVALLSIAPASVSANGVVKVSAKMNIDGADVINTLDLQVVPGKVSLGGVAVSPSSVQVGQSITVSVDAFVNGVAPRLNALSVAFSSNCGVVTPASASVDSLGKASAVIQTKQVGTCSVAATTDGLSAPLSANYAVTSAPIEAAAKLELVDSQGKVLVDPSLSHTETRSLKITAKNLQAFKQVEVTLDNDLAVITPQSGTLLTNESGVALLNIAPAAVSGNGAIRVSARMSTDGADLIKTLDLQVVPGNVSLGSLSVAPGAVQIGQAITVSVNAFVNGVAARSNAVSVVFSSACGVVAPAAAPVDSTGKASAVIQTTLAGTCSVLAATAGVATPPAANYSVSSVPAFGVRFVKADPQIIYMKDSVGATSSLLTFKVFDASGAAVAGQKVNASSAGSGLADFCGLFPQAVSAAVTGEVSFRVCSGNQPDTVQIRATLDANTTVGTDSNLLTIQTGLPSQRFFDLVPARLNFYAGGYFTDQFSGLTVPITAFAADRQGNPVADGTPVIFVAEGGQINLNGQSSCILRNGSCTVDLIGQNYRPMGSSVLGADPRPGRVTVLAMADGEEHYIDANNNNRYDRGESFEDLGRPFLDKDEDGVFTPAYANLVTGTFDGDASYPMAPNAEGLLSCGTKTNWGLSVANTCNGEWNGSGVRADGTRYAPTKVRRAITVVFSGGAIGLPNAQTSAPAIPPACSHSFAPGAYDATIPDSYRTALMKCGSRGMSVRLADLNGNPLPADATLAVAVRKLVATGKCVAALSGGATVIGNSTEPTSHQIFLTECDRGDLIDLSVTVNKTKTSTFSVTVPPP